MDDDNNRHNNNNMNPKTYNINLSSTRIEPTRTINMNIPSNKNTKTPSLHKTPTRPTSGKKRNGSNRKTSYHHALHIGSWQEGINSPRGNENRIKSDVKDLDKLEYSRESLTSGVELQVLAEHSVRKRKKSVPVITSLALSESLSNGSLNALSRQASQDFEQMPNEQKKILKLLYAKPAPQQEQKATSSPQNENGVEDEEGQEKIVQGEDPVKALHVGHRVYEAHTKTEINNAQVQLQETLQMQVSKSITQHVNRFNARPMVQPWDITLEKHGRHFPRVLVTEKHIQNRTYFQRMKLPKIYTGPNEMRFEMNMLDNIADPLKKMKQFIRQKSIEAKKKGRRKTLMTIRKAVTQGRSVFGKNVYDVIDLCDAIDRDGDGNLDREEIANAFTRMGIGLPKSDMKNFLDLIDVNGDGEIDYEELAAALNLPFDKEEVEKRNNKKYNQSRKPRKVQRLAPKWIPPPSGWGLVGESTKILI